MIALSDITALVDAGLCAPSGDNCQPWAFEWAAQTLRVRFEPHRAESLYDVRQAASWIALGALLANTEIAARQHGLQVTTRLFPPGRQDSIVAELAIQRANPGQDPLFSSLELRCVNRRPYHTRPLDPRMAQSLLQVGNAVDNVRLDLVEESTLIGQIAALAALNDRMVFENQALHHGLFRWIRWTMTAARQSGDGLPLACLELPWLERPGFWLLRSWACSRLCAWIGVTRLLPYHRESIYRRSAAMALFSNQHLEPEQIVQTGRVLERVWLTATHGGIAVQPITGTTFLGLRCQWLSGEGLTPSHRAALQPILGQLREWFGVPATYTPLLLLRLGYADPPTARTLRRPACEVLRSTDTDEPPST